MPQPAYASISALNLGTGFVGVVAGAQRIIPRGVLKGYDLSLAPHDKRLEPDRPKDETTGNEEPRADRTLFVDDSAAPADVGQRWRGTVKTEELPGGGLHRHVGCNSANMAAAGLICYRKIGAGDSAPRNARPLTNKKTHIVELQRRSVRKLVVRGLGYRLIKSA